MRGSTRNGVVLIAVGLLLVSLSFGTSWALAEDTTSVAPGVERNDTTTVVGVQGPGPAGNVTVLDGHGDVRWAYGNAISYQDVTYLDDGRVLATFADESTRCGPYKSPCKRTGVRFIDPTPRPHVVQAWSYPVRTRKDSEVHDAELLPSGELLVADMEYESVFTVNMTTGERTWTWNASDHYDAPPDPTRRDWLHINDVDRIGEGRYLVSVRNTNQLVVVERGEGVVEVINRNGDPTVLDKQHNPQWLGDGAVVVADSENDRVVELHRNETSGRWEVAWVLTEADGIPFEWPRDADRLPNGNTLITDSRNDRVVEVTPNGSVVSSYHTDPLPYEADRVPHEESARRKYVAADGESGVTVDASRKIPVLSTLLAAAHHVVPVPYWISELHLTAALLAGGLCFTGGYLVVRGRD